MNIEDIINEKKAFVSDEQMTVLSNACTRMEALEYDKVLLETQLADLNERLQKVKTQEIPELMKALGFESIKLTSGRQVSLARIYNCSVKTAEAFIWLQENGHDSIIKTEVSLAFGKGEMEQAEAAYNALTENGYNPSLEQNVHPQTAKAWMKSLYEEQGLDEFPFELFNASVFTVAKLK